MPHGTRYPIRHPLLAPPRGHHLIRYIPHQGAFIMSLLVRCIGTLHISLVITRKHLAPPGDASWTLLRSQTSSVGSTCSTTLNQIYSQSICISREFPSKMAWHSSYISFKERKNVAPQGNSTWRSYLIRYHPLDPPGVDHMIRYIRNQDAFCVSLLVRCLGILHVYRLITKQNV
jgi:hypothetical protein